MPGGGKYGDRQQLWHAAADDDCGQWRGTTAAETDNGSGPWQWQTTAVEDSGRGIYELLGGGEHMGVIFTNSHAVSNKFCLLCVCSMFLQSLSVQKGFRGGKGGKTQF